MTTTWAPTANSSTISARESEGPTIPIKTSGQELRPSTKSGIRKDIEGLRALAVLLVVAYHAGVGAGGYVGVDVFFVISGFLITRLLFTELQATGRLALGRFYGRRMIRLLPASTAVLAATVAASWHWMSPLEAKAISGDALAASGWMLNYKLAYEGTDYLASQRDPSPLQHFWSLAVEEQFYLIWPVLLVASSLVWLRRGRPSKKSAILFLGCLTLASFAFCVWQTSTNQTWAYFGLPARAWELGVGALIALSAGALGRIHRSVAALGTWIGLAAIVAAAVRFTEATPFPGYAAALPVLGTALVIGGGATTSPWAAESVLRLGPLQEIGRLSYSWYLWHWPVLILAPHVTDRPLTLWEKVGLMAAALIPASISLAAVETRVRLHPALRARPSRGLVLGTALSIVAAGTAAATLQIRSEPVSHGTATDASAVAAAPDDSASDLGKLIEASTYVSNMPGNLTPPLSKAATDFPRDGKCSAPLNEKSVSYNIKQGCEGHGDTTSTHQVVLFGDSHAAQWFDALNDVALQMKWRLIEFTKDGCTPAAALTYKGATRVPYEECAKWRAEVIDRITVLKPAIVVMSSLTYSNSPLDGDGRSANDGWATAWSKTIAAIRSSGAQPVVIQDTPKLQSSVPNCLSANPTLTTKCHLDARSVFDLGRRQAITDAGNRLNAKVIDPADWFCTKTVCPVIVGDTLVYRDASHITATYSKLLSSNLRKSLI